MQKSVQKRKNDKKEWERKEGEKKEDLGRKGLSLLTLSGFYALLNLVEFTLRLFFPLTFSFHCLLPSISFYFSRVQELLLFLGSK